MDKRSKQLKLPLWAAALAAVLLSGCITLLALWCQPNALRTVAIRFLHQPLLIVLNALPVGLLVLGFACLLRNVFFGAAAADLIVGLLAVANRVKLEVRDEPVFPRDLALLKEVGSALKTYDIRIPWVDLALVLGSVVLLAVLGIFIGCVPLSRNRRTLGGAARYGSDRAGRLLGGAASFAALTAVILTVCASDTLYNSFSVTNPYYIPSVFNELGFPYCFCHQFTTYTVDRPAGYSRAQAEAWETGDTPGQGKDVHVIFVMNEAFSGLTDQPMFRFSPGDDPLRELHALQADPHALSGRLVVPGFAGGTANTEFDVLTGMQTNALSEGGTSALRAVNRNLDSLFRVFAADGYRTSYFHPGDDWFYNRENVYRWFGAETTRFKDEMSGIRYKGWWISDDYVAELIEREFEEAVDAGELLFHFSTTIQNHMSYTAAKYGEDYVFDRVPVSAELSEEAQTMVDVYVDGLRDGDAMLGRLHRYFEARQEPVVLVFFGDHLPYLGGGQTGYAELGSDVALPEEESSDPLIRYEVPYVIWANGAAAAALDWTRTAAALSGADERLSACYLGGLVLELTGRGDESPWFAFLNELRREAPVMQNSWYLTGEGKLVRPDGLTEAARQAVSRHRRWSYYKLKQKHLP